MQLLKYCSVFRLELKNHVWKVFTSDLTVWVIKNESIETVFQEKKTFLRLGLGNCVFLKFEDFLALYLFGVFFDGMLLEPLNLINPKPYIKPLKIKLPNK